MTPVQAGREQSGVQGKGTASVEAIRAQFPALERVHGGAPIAYFDGPGGTQVPRRVAEAMNDYLYHHNANTHWAYPTSEESDALIAAARVSLAALLNASPREVAFGANMTTLTFHLARALGRGWGPGDEVIITELDHHANQAPWRAIERERGITIRVVPIDLDTYELDWAALERAFTPRTRLVALTAGSNALGTIPDVTAATRLARAAGALCFVDAVHYTPHGVVDVRAIDCDFLACSAYKFYGPHIGVLYGKADRLAALDVPKLQPAPDTVPERLETGTMNHEGIIGAGAAVEFLASIGTGATPRARIVSAMTELHARGEQLFARLWDGLGAIPGVTCHGPNPGRPRTPTGSFTIRGMAPEAAARRLSAKGVFVSHGDYYASTVVERLGLQPDGMIRAGCLCYTNDDEVNRLLEGVAAIARA
ncbi:MAG: cysteine desulfurase-like protein [Gemmatimonadetes bacterium]|nr:cysteine desulfurase-like protein [Gemmatimonadota bacterium]